MIDEILKKKNEEIETLKDALSMIWLGDWSAISATENVHDFAYEVLEKLGYIED